MARRAAALVTIAADRREESREASMARLAVGRATTVAARRSATSEASMVRRAAARRNATSVASTVRRVAIPVPSALGTVRPAADRATMAPARRAVRAAAREVEHPRSRVP